MLEETEAKLDTQNAPHGFINRGLCPLALWQKLTGVLIVKAADHLHFYAGIQRQARRFFVIRGDAVIDELFDGSVIADDEPVELPFAAQNFRQRKRIS